MKPFRKNLAIVIDGGGIRGVIPARALSMLEQELGQPLHKVARLFAGTSTGSIISAALAAGLTASKINELYLQLGKSVFRRSWRTFFFPLTRYRYSPDPLKEALHNELGDMKMGDFWNNETLTLIDVVITTFDVLANETLFIKPWKSEYQSWPVVKAVLTSSSAPTYFPPVEGRYVDGGVGSYANPCYLAAYELTYCLGWLPEETTLISLGTGRSPDAVQPGQPERFWPWNWLDPVLDAFLSSANDQQVRLVQAFFTELDFRRFQVDLKDAIPMDDVSRMAELSEYGTQMGHMILQDQLDSAMKLRPARPRRENK